MENTSTERSRRTKEEILTANERPPTLEVLYDNIPAELREKTQWAVWRWVWPQGKNRWTKLPIDAKNGNNAKSDDKETWSTFERAMAYYKAKKDSPALRVDGILFCPVEDDGLVLLDPDDCRDPETGEIDPWAKDIYERINSYTEISPSETGFHIITRGKLRAEGRKSGALDWFDKNHFVAMTGHILGERTTIKRKPNALNELHSEMFAKKETLGSPSVGERVPLTDEQIMEKAAKKHGDKFQKLWKGEWKRIKPRYPSWSEAVFGLCGMLSFWSGDAEQINRLVEKSGMYPLNREKWDRIGKGAIAKILRKRTTFYTGGKKGETDKEVPLENESIAPITTERGRTDFANGKRFVARYGKDILWCDPKDKWFTYDGKRWAEDETCQVEAWAKEVTDGLWKDLSEAAERIGQGDLTKIRTFCRSSNGATGKHHLLDMARSEPGIPVTPLAFDQDIWLLNCENGTLDLRTGVLRPHSRDDRLCCLCPTKFIPEAKCPKFTEFMKQVFDMHPDMIDYVQRHLGHALSGDVSEQICNIWWGGGGNGKSTLLNAVMKVVGRDFFITAPPDLLLVPLNERHPTELATLFGKRLLVCDETGAGRPLNEARLKNITGGDKLMARWMRENFFEFDPTHDVIIRTNNKPVIRGADEGIWTRIRLVPFVHSFRGKKGEIKGLGDILAAEEREGILAWMFAGFQRWRKEGLKLPGEVVQATAEYREAEKGLVEQFIDEMCETTENLKDESFHTSGGVLYSKFTEWCARRKEKEKDIPSLTAFGRRLGELGHVDVNPNSNKMKKRAGIRPRGSAPKPRDGGN